MANVNVGQGQTVKIFKIATPTYVYFDKTVHITSLQINCLIFFLNGGCEGQIKVRCEMFYTFEIAIHLSIHGCQNNDSRCHTLSDTATLVNTAAIFKNGGCECQLSPNIP